MSSKRQNSDQKSNVGSTILWMGVWYGASLANVFSLKELTQAFEEVYGEGLAQVDVLFVGLLQLIANFLFSQIVHTVTGRRLVPRGHASAKAGAKTGGGGGGDPVLAGGGGSGGGMAPGAQTKTANHKPVSLSMKQKDDRPEDPLPPASPDSNGATSLRTSFDAPSTSSSSSSSSSRGGNKEKKPAGLSERQKKHRGGGGGVQDLETGGGTGGGTGLGMASQPHPTSGAASGDRLHPSGRTAHSAEASSRALGSSGVSASSLGTTPSAKLLQAPHPHGKAAALPPAWLRCCLLRPVSLVKRTRWSDFLLGAAGGLRCVVLVAGIVLLQFSTVSFAEAIKSTSPLFTVIFSLLLLNEPTRFAVQLSLLPVVGGLMLMAGSEVAFSWMGFGCGLVCVCAEALLNVVCKPLCATYGAVEVQFFTATVAVTLATPGLLYALESSMVVAPSARLGALLLLNALAFHLQWLSQFWVMGLVGTVSLSVANVLKRALITLASLVYFQNPVTPQNAAGMGVIFAGLVAYTGVKHSEKGKKPGALAEKV